MKKCELCSHLARMYCESDGASLCYDCDEAVHSANFLVAKHSRTLLCQKCQIPTPWLASGVKLGRAASVCVSCVGNASSSRSKSDEGVGFVRRQDEQVCRGNDEVEDSDGGEDGDSEDDGEYSENGGDDAEEEDEDEDGENQVVPWACSPSPPPPATPASSEDFSSSRFSSGFVSGPKRTRENDALDSEDDTGCSSGRVHGCGGGAAIMSSGSPGNSEGTSLLTTTMRPPKVLRSEAKTTTEGILNSLPARHDGAKFCGSY